jgi:thiosulfate dehydrogenase
MKPRTRILAAAIATAMLNAQALAQQLPSHQTGAAANGNVVVELCDGVTKMEVPGLKPGQNMTHAQALAVTRALMADWARKHPDQHWEVAQGAPEGGGSEWTDQSNAPEKSPTPAAALPTFPIPGFAETPESSNSAEPTAHRTHHPRPATPIATTGQAGAGSPIAEATPANPIIGGTGHKQMAIQQGDTYASFNDRDKKVWQANTDRFVQQGKEVFHDASKLGGTIGVSCDMCHPDAANTHPETYPKYQVQLQRVALLRDMIEWCIENPVKGKTMDPNDPRLRAMEAYILSQRKGVALDYGKH